MQIQRNPILIVAQSGRFLAQSATQAGYPVWVADCFGDTDTLSVAERWHALPPISALTHDSIFTVLSELSQGENCQLLCGSGVEQYYHILHPLPDNIQLIGNTVDTIHHIQTPSLFFALLKQLALAYPETQLEPPKNTHHWLVKEATGLGGVHIQHLQYTTSTASVTAKHYYQRLIIGISGSCLFLADGQHTQLVSINKQTLSPTQLTPYRLGQIESPWHILASHQHTLEHAVASITAATHLVGLNSLDFIISDHDGLLILEINPRPSASAELITDNTALFQQHIDACLGQLPHPPRMINQTSTTLRYHYASTTLTIPEKMGWPANHHDLPPAGSIIKQDDPLCTSCRLNPK